MDTYEASLDNLYKMLGSITSTMEEKGFAMADITQVEIACEEAFVNIINYAYKDLENIEKYLKVSCGFDEKNKVFCITVRDGGVAFNPFEDNSKKLTLTGEAEEREMGGLGIYFMQQVMDKVDYKREHNENILTLEKKLK